MTHVLPPPPVSIWHLLSRSTGMVVGIIGAVVLAGWAFDVDALKSVLPGMVSMKANTALNFLLCGLALTLLSRKTPGKNLRFFIAAISILAGAIGLLSIAEQLTGWNFHIDQFLFADRGIMDGSRLPGRMSPTTGFCFALLGAALTLKALSPLKNRAPLLMALGAAVMAVGGLALIGYLSDAAMGHRYLNYTGMAVHTALGFIALGWGVATMTPATAPLRWSLGKLGTAGFIAGTLLMLLVQGIAFDYAKKMESAAGWVSHTIAVLKEIRDVQVALANLEDAQRGYLITANEHLLDLRNDNKNALDDHLHILRRLTLDNPDQQTSLDQVENTAAKRAAFQDQTIAVAHTQGLSAGRELIASGIGINLSIQLERLLALMSDRENDLLTTRQQNASNASTMTYLLLPLGFFLSLTTLAAGLFFLNSSIGEKIRVDRAARSQLEAIFEATADGIVVFNMAGSIVLVNESQAHLIGFASADEMKRNFAFSAPSYELFHPDGTPVPIEQWPRMKALRGESFVNWEIRVRQKNLGREWFFSCSGRPVYNESGRQVLAVVTTHDITERKRTEARAARLIDSNAQGVMFWNLKGEIIQANDAFLRIIGYSRDDLNAGRLNWKNITPPEFAHLDRRSLVQLAATGICTPFEKEYIRRDGSRVPVLIGACAFEDNPEEGVCFVLDRTESRHANDALRKSEAQLHTIIENIGEAVVVSDLNGHLLHFNQAALDMLGYESRADGRRHFAELTATHQLSGMNNAPWTVDQWPLARILRGENLRHLEAHMQRIGAGSPRAFSFGGTIAHDPDGKPLLAVVTFSDITERKNNEATLETQRLALQLANLNLAEKNARLSELYQTAQRFMDDVSHEFRTPLAVIKGYSEIMRDGIAGPQSSEQSHFNQLIIDRTRNMTQMVDDLLDSSKLRAGSLRVDRRPADIAAIFAALQPTFDTLAASSKIQCIQQIEPALPQVFADAEKVTRILVNLLLNAIKFSPPASRIVLSAKPDPSGNVLISVQDQGQGISPENLALIFQCFHQVGNSLGSTKGFGLGLNIARELVSLNLGHMSVISELHNGSTFSFTLPSNQPHIILARLFQNLEERSTPPGAFAVLHVTPQLTSAPAPAFLALRTFLACSSHSHDVIIPTPDADALILFGYSAKPLEWHQRLVTAGREIEQFSPSQNRCAFTTELLNTMPYPTSLPNALPVLLKHLHLEKSLA